MATQTLSTADAILKDLYTGPVIEQLNYKTWMLDKIERDSDSVDFTGRRWVHPVHKGRNRQRGSFVDGGGLVTPGKQDWVDAIDTMKYHDSGVELTDQAIKQATGNNDGAFLNLLDAEVKGCAADLRKDINRQVYGDGTGLLAGIEDSATSTSVTLSTTQYVDVGDPIDIVTIANGTVIGSVTITAVNRTTRVITISASTAHSTAEGIYLQGSYGLEMPGLRNMVSTSRTLHGINSATAGNEFWNAKRVDAGSTVAGESLFEQLADEIGAGGNGDVDVFITSRGIRRRLADTYASQKRWNDAKATQIHGGYSAIWVNEVPVVADDDAPRRWVFALGMDAFKWFQVGKPDWLKAEDASVWHLKNGATAGSKVAAWQAWFIWYATLGNLAPNRTGAIINATDDAL